MLRDDEHWLALTDAFYSAALAQQGWYEALHDLAEATGSANGELIGLGANAAVPFNIFTNIDPDFEKAFVEVGGGNPLLNPRVNAGMNAPVLKVLAESDFITPEEHKRHPHYREFASKWNVPYICLTPLERNNGMLIGLAVARTAGQGHITEPQREIFASFAPHVRAAVRMQIALEGEGAALLVGAMDSLSMPAFIHDRLGKVRALTPAAEQLLSAGRGLTMRAERLVATHPANDRALNDALNIALRGRAIGGPPGLQTVLIRQEVLGEPSLVLDIITLPSRAFELGFAPRVMVLARGERGNEERRAAILKTAYALTPAETEIALHVANGLAPDVIAAMRGASVATVRFQIKSIMVKIGVRRQVELASLVGRL
ncbi:MAG: helix-turn-helix transcriptional regulator [Proteobacteria bacterium]|nr:helix-turn-helix transcriptional regulator [Pseudomonadota bacterium]